ncbi:hypothetical protein DVH05_027781 [Phytophthora capsici]|nr:hypothetical protein DVH05_027781 [Phytophthora capsici]
MDGGIGDFGALNTGILEALLDNTQNQTSAQQKKKKLNYDPNKARNERRFELSKLRCQVKELEMKLEQLQLIQGKRKRAPALSDHSSQQSQPYSSAMSAVWKETCIRQLDQRLRAERLNIHLKKSCDKEMQVVRHLRKLLYRHPSQRDLVHLGENTRTRRIEIPTGCLKQMASLIFDQLAVGVETSYQIAEVVVEMNSPVSTNEMTQKPLLRDAMNGTRIEVFDHHILPFGMRETADAWWKHWNNFIGKRSEVNVGNVVVESFGLEFTDVVAGTTATFYVQQILRRYIEDERTVIVWNAYVEPFMFENERVTGVYFLEQSHVIIKPEHRDTAEDAVSTRMSSCEIVTPHFLDPRLKDDPKMAALTDFVTSSLSSNIMTRNEKVEDMLLDESLRRGDSNSS